MSNNGTEKVNYFSGVLDFCCRSHPYVDTVLSVLPILLTVVVFALRFGPLLPSKYVFTYFTGFCICSSREMGLQDYRVTLIVVSNRREQLGTSTRLGTGTRVTTEEGSPD